MIKNKSFHPKLIIVDHFDEVKYTIDVKTETILQKHLSERNFVQKNILNELRQNQIEKIEKIQKENLLNVMFEDEKFYLDWCHVINDNKLAFEQKINIIKAALIKKDCILIQDDKYLSGFSLWIIPWFCDPEHLNFLK